MDEFKLLPTIRRATWRLGEVYFLAQFLDLTGIIPGISESIDQHFAAFTLSGTAGSAIYDLFDILNRPYLIDPDKPSCKDDSPMLPFGEEQ